MTWLLRAAAMLLLVMFASAAQAQYPNRPIRIVVPFPPGGAPDLQTRIIAQRLSELLGQPIVTDNRPGSNGVIAGDLAAKAAPDGYTVLLGQDSMFVTNPFIYPKMPFDPMKDLVPVTSTAMNEFFLSVNPSVPVKTVMFADSQPRSNTCMPLGQTMVADSAMARSDRGLRRRGRPARSRRTRGRGPPSPRCRHESAPTGCARSAAPRADGGPHAHRECRTRPPAS